ETEHAEIERARQRGEGRTQHIGMELIAAGGHAERPRGTLAVLDGAQVEAHAAALDPPGKPKNADQHHEEDIVVRHRRDEREIEHRARHGGTAEPLGAPPPVAGRAHDAHRWAPPAQALVELSPRTSSPTAIVAMLK